MADTARGTLEGYVRVTGNVNELRKGAKSIRAWVNGFLQSVVKLKEGRTPHELRFRIPVLLALKENNVTLDLPGLVESENTLVKAVVRCAEPSRDQTLHLLVVSTRVSFQQRQEFEKRVLDLFGVRDGKMPAFSQVISGSPDYPALTGAISRSDSMRSLIDECRFKLSAEQGKNNAVLIYFHGEELRSPDGRSCLLTVDADPEKAFSDSNLITSTFLGSQFEGLKCANLIFLDVTPHVLSASPTVAGDPSEPGLGILRMLREGQTRQSTSPLLLEQVRQLLPGVSDLAELTEALEALNQQRSQLAISDSIPDSVLTMPFGERVTE